MPSSLTVTLFSSSFDGRLWYSDAILSLTACCMPTCRKRRCLCRGSSAEASLFYGWTEQPRPVNPKAEECAS